MLLRKYSVGTKYTIGASHCKQIFWYCLGSPIFSSELFPFSRFKVLILRCFGAKIGYGVHIKPGVKIKFPWRLTIGNYCWLGENSWIDNLASVTIEDNVCISQGVYFCTGNHDWSKETFDLRIAPIYLEEGCWIAARSVIGPGVRVGKGAILTLGSVTAKSLDPMTIYFGNPAQPIKSRKIES